MTIQVLINILLISFAVIMFFGILILVYILGKVSIKDNPKKGYVFVKTGSHVNKPFKAEIHKRARTGESFKYGDSVVIIPKIYQRLYYRNRRMIFVEHLGQLIASPFENEVPISPKDAEDLIYDICESHVGSDGMRALKGKSAINIVIVGVIAFVVGAALVFGFVKFQEIQAQRALQSDTSIEQELQPPVEVK